MGADLVKVSYKERRGSHESGVAITDPKDFFQMAFSDEETFAMVKAQYDNAPADKRRAVDAVFDDDEDVMKKMSNGSMWLNENEDNSSAL